MSSRILYLSYDGMTDPLGQSQVIPYLVGLAASGHTVTLISFEKPGARHLSDKIAGVLKKAGIRWIPMAYHKSPPVLSALWDAFAMYRKALLLSSEGRFDVFHCRSYLPALIGLKLKKRLFGKLLFDMRGFWPDERVDGKTWNLKNPVYRLVYRYFKRKEKELLLESDYIVSLTQAARDIMQSWYPRLRIEVIPCCCDTRLFSKEQVQPHRQEALRQQLGLDKDTRLLSYLGALGTFYLLDEMLAFFKELKKTIPGCRFLFITLHDPELVYRSAAAQGIPRGDLVIKAATRDEVPALLSLSFLSVFFITPLFSKSASSPTKQAEVLSMGIPVVCNAGVGDTERIVKENQCGAVVTGFSADAFREAIEFIQKTTFDANQICATASRLFSLDLGIERYEHVYRMLETPDKKPEA